MFKRFIQVYYNFVIGGHGQAKRKATGLSVTSPATHLPTRFGLFTTIPCPLTPPFTSTYRRVIQGYILFAAIFISGFASAQQVNVRGSFLIDSVRIGEPIPYSLTVRYAKKLDILFPDSTFSFAPFEFHSKKFFPTTTRDTISYDSVVYYLSTYEVDQRQRLSLPVFIVHPQDCTQVFAAVDSMRLIKTVKLLPDTIAIDKLPLKMNIAYQKVNWVLNYPLLLLIIGIIAVVLITVWALFGKRIRTYFVLRKLERNHLMFITKFTTLTDQLKSNLSSTKVEETLLIWKKYMEDLAAKPFTKYTSKEIAEHEQDITLGLALRSIDRMIYGGLNEVSHESMVALRTYSEQQYHKKTEEVKNG